MGTWGHDGGHATPKTFCICTKFIWSLLAMWESLDYCSPEVRDSSTCRCSSQQPRPAPTDTSRSPQSTRRQPARLARNCAVRSPRVPLSPARSRSADAVAAPRSRFVSLCRRCKHVTC
ncbi:hypothetical protein WN943_005996 [Citrus x changshan-huyou]